MIEWQPEPELDEVTCVTESRRLSVPLLTIGTSLAFGGGAPSVVQNARFTVHAPRRIGDCAFGVALSSRKAPRVNRPARSLSSSVTQPDPLPAGAGTPYTEASSGFTYASREVNSSFSEPVLPITFAIN